MRIENVMRCCLKILLFLLLSLPLVSSGGTYDEAALKKNVKKFRRTGIVIEKIPQISQRRNFCVPATVGMVLRYYDVKIPQRRLASIFETSRRKGTAGDDMAAAFGHGKLEDFSIEAVYRLTVREFEEMEQALDDSSGRKRKRKRSRRERSYADRFAAMDPRAARKIFPGIRRETAEKLRTALTAYVAAGIPVLWCVEMRFDPEDKVNGGHMRLITGFIKNKDTGKIDQVVYRDSWGNATDNKIMSFNDAVTMTTELWVIHRNK